MPTISANPTTQDAAQARRLELILRQVDALPTLPVVATRLLSLTASDTSTAGEVVELISADQSLTAKVLSMCRAAYRGAHNVTTVEKAVVMLGFDAIRSAVLSVKVIEAFDIRKKRPKRRDVVNAKGGAVDMDSADASDVGDQSAYSFDHVEFWRHSLAVAIAAERIAEAHGSPPDLRSNEAFVCGLLHDIGKLALERILPKSYERVIELVEINQNNIAEFERRIIGMDHHLAGKRLAEQWQLPHLLQDCIWLHGSPWESLPPLEHKRMVALVTLADLVARMQHVGFSGNFVLRPGPAELAKQMGLDPAKVEAAVEQLHELTAARAAALGLDDQPSAQSYLKAVQHANDMLGKLNAALTRRGQICMRQQHVLDAVTAFHGSGSPGRTVEDVLGSAIVSAVGVMGAGYFGALYQPRRDGPWVYHVYNSDGSVLSTREIDPPAGTELSSIDANNPALVNQMSILPWLSDHLGDGVDVRQIRMLPLGCAWGTAALLLHDRAVLPPWPLLSAATATWGAAIAAAAQHEGARRLGEQLADANHALAETQDKLLRSESMARLGEMAAGAAHEMNNPLAVISGRAQILVQTLPPGGNDFKSAQMIYEQAHRISDLITALRLYADPPRAERRPVDIAAILDEAVKRLRQKLNPHLHCPINLQLKKEMPTVLVDGNHMRQIVHDLVLNAVQAQPKTAVHVSARIDVARNLLIIQVSDDGVGMDEHTLTHAMDPFFSSRPAGRGVGMGLPRAQQLATTHGGKIELRSTMGEGTLATVTIPLHSPA